MTSMDPTENEHDDAASKMKGGGISLFSPTAWLSSPRSGFITSATLAAVSSSFGGLITGVQLALLSGLLEIPSFEATLAPTTSAKAMLSSALLFGSMVFVVPAGPFCDRWGRRSALLLAAGLSLAATTVMVLTSSTNAFIGARVTAGAAVAVLNMVCPMYASEIASVRRRSLYVSLYQVWITVGIFGIQVVSAVNMTGPDDFRRPLRTAQIPCVGMMLAVAFLAPETPGWLEARGRNNEAAIVRRQLELYSARTEYEEQVDDVDPSRLLGEQVNRDLEASIRSDSETSIRQLTTGASKRLSQDTGTGFGVFLRNASARKRLAIATGVQIGQQVSGMNNVVFYAPTMISAMLTKDAGEASSVAITAAAAIGLFNVIATLIGIMIVERVDRVSLLLFTSIPMMLGHLALAWSASASAPTWVGIAGIFVFVGAFAIGWGAVPFLVSSEVFPVRYRGRGLTVSGLCMSIASLIVTGSFLQLHEKLGTAVFIGYFLLVLASAVFVLCKVPETRGLSQDRIDRMLG